MEFVVPKTEMQLRHGDNTLVGDLHRSPSDVAVGIVAVFVEGSGPGGRDQGKWPTTLAGCGLDSLAFDKPGCGASSGDWTAQSIEERAEESLAAVRLAASLGYERIALIGGSQGGWVARLAAAQCDLISAVVTTSAPAVGVAEQERYRLRTQLPAEGVAPAEVEAAQLAFDERLRRLVQGASGAEICHHEARFREAAWYRYLAGTTPREIDLLGRLIRHDPLPPLRAVDQPMLSLYGSADVVVDVPETVRLLERERGDRAGDLVVVVPGADHSLRQPTGPPPHAITGGHFQPGETAPGVIALIGTWIERVAR